MRIKLSCVTALAVILGLSFTAVFQPVWAAGTTVDDAAAARPAISIFNLRDGDSFAGGLTKIIYNVSTSDGAIVDRIEVLIDGQTIGVPRGVDRADAVPSQSGSTAGQVVVPLPARDVAVSLIAYAGDRASTPATVKLVWAGAAGDGFKPKLYAVVIGVSR